MVHNAKLPMIVNNFQLPTIFQKNARLQFVTKLLEDVSLNQALTPLVLSNQNANTANQKMLVKLLFV
jgi:hypothetical protein